MLSDIEQYCQSCLNCQASKQPSPPKAPLISMPVGRPWEMVAVDILQLPLSCQNNRYLLVIQDYFTKWAEAIPLPDQTASRITKELVKVFTRMAYQAYYTQTKGPTSKVPYSDKPWMLLVYRKPTLLHITRKGMEWWDGLIKHFSKCSDHTPITNLTGNDIFHWFCMLIDQPPIHLLECPHLSLCLDVQPCAQNCQLSQHLTHIPISSNFGTNLQSAKILWRHILPKPLVARKLNMIVMQRSGRLRRVTMFGFLAPQQGS
jgi:hypothetical protein